MDGFNIKDFLDPKLVVVAVVLYLIGMWLKKSNFFADKLIPLALWVISVIICAIWYFANGDATGAKNIAMMVFQIITQSVICVGVPVWVNQVVSVQPKRKE